MPWIAGFSSGFVKDSINSYLKGEGTILDPFAGVGTTLIEAMLAGHSAVGFEINPYASFACNIKTTAHQVAAHDLQNEIIRFHAFHDNKKGNGYTPQSKPPLEFKTRSEFYSPGVLRKVLISWDFIGALRNTEIQNLFRLAFASTMVSYSNYSYEPSLGRRKSAGKKNIHSYPVVRTIISKLMEMEKDISWFQAKLARRKPKVKIINDSFFKCRSYLKTESVDLIITSPPYLNNYHYNRNTRPQLYWLDFVKRPLDMKDLEASNVGTYWQTVRELELVELDFSLPDSDLLERLEVLRKLNPEKGIYGGKGWANYAAAYFNDSYKSAQAMHFVLKPGGTALIVIGNSILQGTEIPTDKYLGMISELAGLKLIDIHIPRAKRIGNSIIKSNVRVGKAKASHRLYEAIVELRKE